MIKSEDHSKLLWATAKAVGSLRWIANGPIQNASQSVARRVHNELLEVLQDQGYLTKSEPIIGDDDASE